MTRPEKRIPVTEETVEARGAFEGAGATWNDALQDLVERSHELNRRALLDRTEDDGSVPLEDGCRGDRVLSEQPREFLDDAS